MMRLEKIVLTEKEDKQEFISMLMSISLESPIIYNILSHFAFTYKESPQNRLRVILNEHYEELLQLIVKTLLMENVGLQSAFEEYIKMDVRPVIINKEDFIR